MPPALLLSVRRMALLSPRARRAVGVRTKATVLSTAIVMVRCCLRLAAVGIGVLVILSALFVTGVGLLGAWGSGRRSTVAAPALGTEVKIVPTLPVIEVWVTT